MPCSGDPIECTWEAALGDLEARLERAAAKLDLMQQSATSRSEVLRLKSKREGVKLALSYAREY